MTWALSNLDFDNLGNLSNTTWVTWALDNLGDLDFGQHAYSNDWETFVLKNLTHAFEAESISGFFFSKNISYLL